MLTKRERKVINEAADLIERELSSGEPVRILNFGLFYTTPIMVCLDHPSDEDATFELTHIQQRVVFRPYDNLKTKVANRKPLCSVNDGKSIRCYHPDGDGHEGYHVSDRLELFRVINGKMKFRRDKVSKKRIKFVRGKKDA